MDKSYPPVIPATPDIEEAATAHFLAWDQSFAAGKRWFMDKDSVTPERLQTTAARSNETREALDRVVPEGGPMLYQTSLGRVGRNEFEGAGLVLVAIWNRPSWSASKDEAHGS